VYVARVFTEPLPSNALSTSITIYCDSDKQSKYAPGGERVLLLVLGKTLVANTLGYEPPPPSGVGLVLAVLVPDWNYMGGACSTHREVRSALCLARAAGHLFVSGNSLYSNYSTLYNVSYCQRP
jgi:hypothetical protein